MSEKPVMHGWDHRPGGMDPIPGLAGFTGLPYIAGTAIVGTLASGTGLTDVDLDPATISWGTDSGAETASSYFDLRQISGAGPHGVTLLQNGLYVADFWASMDLSSAPAANSCGELGLRGAGSGDDIGGDGDAAPWVLDMLGTRYRTRPYKRSMLNWPPSYGTPPLTHIVSIGQNSGASVSTIVVEFMVVWVNSGNTGF